MIIRDIVKELGLKVVAGDTGIDKNVEGVYIGDLLSLVMAKAESSNIWITIQTHINVMAVATLVDISAVLIAEGVEIDEATINKSNEEGIPLLKSDLSAYELACKLKEMGL